VQVRKWPEVVVGGWKKRRKRRTETQNIKGGLAHNTKVDREVNLRRDVMFLGSDL
jgi:hypothetical protein